MKHTYIFRVKGRTWRIVAHSYEIAYMMLKVLTHNAASKLDYIRQA